MRECKPACFCNWVFLGGFMGPVVCANSGVVLGAFGRSNLVVLVCFLRLYAQVGGGVVAGSRHSWHVGRLQPLPDACSGWCMIGTFAWQHTMYSRHSTVGTEDLLFLRLYQTCLGGWAQLLTYSSADPQSDLYGWGNGMVQHPAGPLLCLCAGRPGIESWLSQCCAGLFNRYYKAGRQCSAVSGPEQA